MYAIKIQCVEAPPNLCHARARLSPTDLRDQCRYQLPQPGPVQYRFGSERKLEISHDVRRDEGFDGQDRGDG